MNVPPAVGEFVRAQGWGEVTGQSLVGGGCINNGERLTTSNGPDLFLKTNSRTPPDMFARESEGLVLLRSTNALRLPEPHLHGPDFLLLEFILTAPKSGDYWERLGTGLAHLHLVSRDRFGFDHDNYIGSTPQPNPWTDDGFAFFAEHQLLFQGRLARERGLLTAGELMQMERLAARLRELIPVQPASLIHGDLWGGNVMVGPEGEPVLVDPAAHFGWAEAELGITTLFGRFPDRCYSAYQTVCPLEPGWERRLEIYNLYHLLNHLNLFGSGYHGQVADLLLRYG